MRPCGLTSPGARRASHGAGPKGSRWRPAEEALADAISVQRHPLLGRAKDLGSAAVMLTLALAAGCERWRWTVCGTGGGAQNSRFRTI